MKLSDKQENIKKEWQNTENNILIKAVAGSGKTTMLIELLKTCKHRTLILSFNSSIQKEFQEKIEKNDLKQGKAMTVHSLGLKALNSHMKVSVNKGKSFDLIKKLQDQEKIFFKYLKWEDKVKLSYTLMDMNDVSRLFLTDDYTLILKQMKTMDKSVFITDSLDKLWKAFVGIRDASYREKVVDIDFIDMIYLPVVNKIKIPIAPYYLMIDEAQDLSWLLHAFISNLIGQGDVHKWIAVGDPNQSIYGFSGAYNSSFDLFKAYDNVVELPLDICYRCPKSVITAANEIYDVMLPYKQDLGKVGIISNALDVKDNSMIICRNSNPLIELYFYLIGNGRKAQIKGEDIAKSVNKFLKPFTYQTVDQARVNMQQEISKLSDNTSTEEDKIKYYVYKENYKNFLLLSRNLVSGLDKVSVLINKFQALMNSKGEGITLCTIHKAKGLEADIVYILDESLIPSKFAKSQQQLIQERNLKYVARTRAKKEMYYLNI